MNKFLIFFVLIIIIVLTVLFFPKNEIINPTASNQNQQSEQNHQVNPGNTQNTNILDNQDPTSPFTDADVSAPTAGNGSGNEESSGSRTSESNNEHEFILASCNLIRPGNIPNVDCSANYITSDSVSLLISNSIGEQIDVEVSLETCSPNKIEKLIGNNQEENFIFSCNNEDFFEEEVSITYIINENTIEVFGFVTGTI